MSDDDLIRRGDALALPPYDGDGDPAGQWDHHVFVRRDAIAALPAAPLDALTLERAAQVARESWDDEDAETDPNWTANLIRALTPEPAHVTAARVVKIKPLVWEQSAGGVWIAQTGLGSHYSVADSQWFYGPMMAWVWVEGGDEAAKAAAQADYEARIRSAIVEARHE